MKVVSLEPSLAGRTTGTSSAAPSIEVAAGHGQARLRFTLAHELGHVILARAGRQTRGIPAERLCDAIAGELLIPRAWLLPRAQKIEDLQHLLTAARALRVSPATLSISLCDAGIPNSFVDARRVGAKWYARTWTRAVASSDPFMGACVDRIPCGHLDQYPVGSLDSHIVVHVDKTASRTRLWYRCLSTPPELNNQTGAAEAPGPLESKGCAVGPQAGSSPPLTESAALTSTGASPRHESSRSNVLRPSAQELPRVLDRPRAVNH